MHASAGLFTLWFPGKRCLVTTERQILKEASEHLSKHSHLGKAPCVSPPLARLLSPPAGFLVLLLWPHT